MSTVTGAGRPHLTLLTTQTIDGKIALRGDRVLLEAEQHRAWRELRPPNSDQWLDDRTRGGASVMEGAGTFVRPDVADPDWNSLASDRAEVTGEPWVTGPGWAEDASWMPSGLAERGRSWFVIVDGGPRVAWQFVGDHVSHLLVLTSVRSDPEHRAFLRRMGIPHLVVGERPIDLPRALAALREHLGVTRLIANCGGDLGSALLELDLVDEVDVVVLPAVVGGEDTPTPVDGRRPLSLPRHFGLTELERRGDLVRLHYGRADR